MEGVKILVDGQERSITDKEGYYKLDQVWLEISLIYHVCGSFLLLFRVDLIISQLPNIDHPVLLFWMNTYCLHLKYSLGQ